MNLPNKLTIARVIMIPLFLICLYLNIGCGKYIAVGIFILASLTDLLDGKIARNSGKQYFGLKHLRVKR